MSTLCAVDKSFLYDMFKITGGYILFDMYKEAGKNKSFTKDLILDATGIDIYKDDNNMYNLSQQKCVDKIIADFSNSVVVKFFRDLWSFYKEHTCTIKGCDTCVKERQCNRFKDIMKRLESQQDVILPKIEGQNITEVYQDAVRNIETGNYTLAIDRLHTYSVYFFERLCAKNGITVMRDAKGQITVTLEKLIADLKQIYISTGFLDTDFFKVASRKIANIMQEFGRVRNDKSAAHPNELLSKIEAEFVVKIVCDILTFFKKIDDSTNNKKPTYNDDNLPF